MPTPSDQIEQSTTREDPEENEDREILRVTLSCACFEIQEPDESAQSGC
jgi:hypothetical protein